MRPSYADVESMEPRWTPENVVQLWESGLTTAEIEGSLGVSSATVLKYLHRADKKGLLSRKIKTMPHMWRTM